MSLTLSSSVLWALAALRRVVRCSARSARGSTRRLGSGWPKAAVSLPMRRRLFGLAHDRLVRRPAPRRSVSASNIGQDQFGLGLRLGLEKGSGSGSMRLCGSGCRLRRRLEARARLGLGGAEAREVRLRLELAQNRGGRQMTRPQRGDRALERRWPPPRSPTSAARRAPRLRAPARSATGSGRGSMPAPGMASGCERLGRAARHLFDAARPVRLPRR